MPATFMEGFLTPITGRVVREPVTTQGIGPAIYLAIKAASSAAGDIETVTSADDVATLLSGTKISAQAAADLTVMFSQSVARPPQVYVVIYDPSASPTPETLATAMAYWEAAGIARFGVVTCETRTDADLAVLGTWRAADGRSLRYRAWVQCDTADLLTPTKPAGLANYAVLGGMLFYHSADAQPLAAAAAAAEAGFSLINGPMGTQFQIDGVALPTITQAQIVQLNTNDGLTLTQHDVGATQNQRVIRGIKDYSGADAKASLTVSYATRLMYEAVSAWTSTTAALGGDITTDAPGRADLESRLVATLDPLFVSGHLTAGTLSAGTPSALSLPRGHQVVVTAAGTVLIATVTLLIGGQVYTISLDTTGVITSQ